MKSTQIRFPTNAERYKGIFPKRDVANKITSGADRENITVNSGNYGKENQPYQHNVRSV